MCALLRESTLNLIVNYWQSPAETGRNRACGGPLTLENGGGVFAMKSVILATIVIVAGIVSACTVRTERTVVEPPAPAQTAYVYTDVPPQTTTVYVGPFRRCLCGRLNPSFWVIYVTYDYHYPCHHLSASDTA